MARQELRPLGLGELLDRAVTLSTRNAGVMLAAVAVPYLPDALLQWAMLGDRYGRGSLTQDQWHAIGILTVVDTMVFLFARAAAAQVAYERYAGRPIALGTVFRTAFARFGALLGMTLVATLCLVPLIMVFSVPVALIGVITAAFGAPSVVVGASGVGAGLVLFVPASLWFIFAYDLATVRVALGAKPSTAVFRALRVTAFRRPWRSLLAGVIAGLIPVAIPLILQSAAKVIPFAPLRVFLELAVVNIAAIVAEVLAVAFFGAYDVDLAVRHEGFDLALALNEPAPG